MKATHSLQNIYQKRFWLCQFAFACILWYFTPYSGTANFNRFVSDHSFVALDAVHVAEAPT
jgi:hypothetical protein